MLSKILTDTLILITVYNPLEAAVVYISIKNNLANDKKNALTSSLTVFFLSFVILYTSSFIFTHIHSNILQGNTNLYVNVVKIIGGVLLFSVGWVMIFKDHSTHLFLNKKEQNSAKQKKNIAIIPMSVPVILGPGVFTVLLILGDKAKNIEQKEELFISLILSIFTIYLTLRFSIKIIKFLGIHGIRILSLITGLFIMFVSSVFFIDGIKGILSFM